MLKAPRTDVIALAALASAAAAAIVLLVLRASGPGANPLSAIPADAFLVVSVDVAALAGSPLGAAIAGEIEEGPDAGTTRAESILGVDSIVSTCGFDPLPHLRAVALAIPEGAEVDGERGDFGVAFAGTLAKDALASCAKAMLARHGGEPVSKEQGSFTVISDGRATGGAAVAFRDGGPYLVGRGAWLARMIDTAEGRIPSALSTGKHAELRADLSARDADAEAVRATAILPRGVRERIAREMAADPKEGPHPGAAMEGVLGVSAAAFGLHAGRPHEDTRLVAELLCDSKSACDAVRVLILHARLGWSGNLAYRFLGLGPLIDGLTVERAPPPAVALVAQTRAPVDGLAKLVERALRGPSGGATPRKAKPIPPDAGEIVAPRADGGAQARSPR